MKKSIISHTVVGSVTAVLASGATYLALAGWPQWLLPAQVHAQSKPAASTPARQTEMFKTTMNDVMGRVFSVRRLERDPGTISGPHRHPGSYTIGYVLEGTYEVKVDDGPLQRLGPGETFYEAPNALHAVSRNGSNTQPAKYLVIQVSDPTKPATVPEH